MKNFGNILTAIIFLMTIPLVGNAVNYHVSANQNWTDLIPTPTSSDNVYIKKGATLTIDVTNAVCAKLFVGHHVGPDKGNGTVIFNANSKLTLVHPDGVFIGSGAYTGTLDMTSGGTLIVEQIQYNAGTVIAGSGTISFTSNNTLPAAITTYNNLMVDSNNTTLAVNTTITGDLTIQNAATLDDGGFNSTFSGNLIVHGTVNSSGKIILDGVGTTIDGIGAINILNVWTFTGDKTILASANLAFTGNYPIDIISGITTINGNITCDSIRVYNNPAAETKLRIDNGALTVNNGALASATTAGAGKKAMIELINTSTMTVNGDLELLANTHDAKCNVKNSSQLIVNGNVKLTDTGGKKAEFKGQDNAIITVNGDIIFNATGKDKAKIKLANTALLNITGNLDRSGVGHYGDLDGAATTFVNFNGTSPQILSVIRYGSADTTKKWRYGEVQINNMAGVTLDADVSQADKNNSIQDDIRIQSGILYSGGYSLELATAKVFEIATNTIYNTTSTDAMGGMLLKGKHDISATGTVNFAATSPQNVPRPINPLTAWDYGHLIISGGDTKTLTGNVDVEGNLTIQPAATFDVNAAINYNINLSGNWNNNGNFEERSGAVTFDGGSSQIITNPVGEIFYSLIINNSKASSAITLDDSVTVTNILTLTDGHIMTTSTDILILDLSATVTGTNDSSFVKGPVRKKTNIAGTFTFPVGKEDNYQPIGMTTQSIDLTTFTAEYFYTEQGYGAGLDASLDHISKIDYWTLDRSATGTPANATVTLHWDGRSVVSGVAAELNDLRVARWDGSLWKDEGQAANMGDSLNGSITSLVVTSFSPFILASKSSANPLPISLLSFDAELIDNEVELTWTTLSETNNDFFTVQRSSDGIDFEIVTYVGGAGNSNQALYYSTVDHDPYYGVSYYRFKQTDYDGQFTYSDVVAVNYLTEDDYKFAVYPVPSDGNFFVDIKGNKDDEMLVVILDQLGKEHYSKVHALNSNGHVLAIDAKSKLASGVYFVVISSLPTLPTGRQAGQAGRNSMYRKKIVIQ